MSPNAINLEFEVKPLRLAQSALGTVQLTLTATNRGSEVVDPELYRAALFVNGERSRVWSLAVGNGRRPPTWYALPPGQSVSMTWSTLGPSLFPHPGHYALELVLDDLRPPPISVQVLAG